MSFNNSSLNTTNIQIYEILAYANDLVDKDKGAAIEYLRNNRSRVIIEGYLKMNYDPSVVFQLPSGQPPFKRQLDVPDGYCLTDLKQEFRRMRIFTDAQMNISKLRREQLWIQMCEGLFWKEADLIAKIKDRRITDLYSNLTSDFVREVFPSSIPEIVAPPIPEELSDPVDFGEDPAKISEEELIKAAISEFIEKEVAPEKKVKAGAKKKVSTPAKKPITRRTASSQKQQTKKKSVSTESAPMEMKVRKKPGPKPKVKTPS
jgi:hypothetical protein